MSFFGVIRPGYAKQDKEFLDRAEFGRFWLKVRGNEDAHNWVVIDHTVYGYRLAKDAVRNRITSRCVGCSREYVDDAHPDGTGISCYGCTEAEMSFHQSPGPEVNASAKWCPALTGGYHRYVEGYDRCQHCQKTKEQAGLVPKQAALVEAR